MRYHVIVLPKWLSKIIGFIIGLFGKRKGEKK